MIIARIQHQSSIRGRKEGHVFIICDLENLVPQLTGEAFNLSSVDECYGIPYFTKEPKGSQEEAQAALKAIIPDYKEVSFSRFEYLIDQRLANLQSNREAKARELGWQKNSTGLACIKCGGPINTTTPTAFGGAWGQIYHGWSKCAGCDQEYCTTYYPDYTRINSNETMPPSWSYKDEKGKYVAIDVPPMLEIAAKWDAILHPVE